MRLDQCCIAGSAPKDRIKERFHKDVLAFFYWSSRDRTGIGQNLSNGVNRHKADPVSSRDTSRQ